MMDAAHWEKGRLEDALREITAYELQLMGGPPPFDPPGGYTFFFHIGTFAEAGGGGMEHANSTAIAALPLWQRLPPLRMNFFTPGM